jgi:hypothetical protein
MGNSGRAEGGDADQAPVGPVLDTPCAETVPLVFGQEIIQVRTGFLQRQIVSPRRETVDLRVRCIGIQVVEVVRSQGAQHEALGVEDGKGGEKRFDVHGGYRVLLLKMPPIVAWKRAAKKRRTGTAAGNTDGERRSETR